MTRKELIEQVIKDAAIVSQDLPFWANTVAVRYDNKDVTAGDELECSISNSDRDDERDFPGYDEDAERMGGTSCYHVCDAYDEEDDMDADWIDGYLSGKSEAAWTHCSLVIGKRTDDYCEDKGETILSNCTVVKVYW
jgi:hypothetical protein